MLRATRGSCVHGEGRGGSLIVIRNEVQAQEKKTKNREVWNGCEGKTGNASVPKSLFMENAKIFQPNLNPGE